MYRDRYTWGSKFEQDERDRQEKERRKHFVDETYKAILLFAVMIVVGVFLTGVLPLLLYFFLH